MVEPTSLKNMQPSKWIIPQFSRWKKNLKPPPFFLAHVPFWTNWNFEFQPCDFLSQLGESKYWRVVRVVTTSLEVVKLGISSPSIRVRVHKNIKKNKRPCAMRHAQRGYVVNCWTRVFSSTLGRSIGHCVFLQRVHLKDRGWHSSELLHNR